MSASIAAKAPPGTKFSFVVCTSKSSSSSSDRHKLLFLGDPRRSRGETEKGLCDIADANPLAFSAWILKPSAVVAAGEAVPRKKRLMGGRSGGGVEVTHLGRAFVKVAVEGWKDRVVDNDAILKM